MIVRFTPMPAYLAALGLAPTVRTSKPKVVRRRMNHTSDAQADRDEEAEVQRRVGADDLGEPGRVGDGRGAGHRGRRVAEDDRVLGADQPAHDTAARCC